MRISTEHTRHSVASFCLLTHLWKCFKSGLVRGASLLVHPFVLWGLTVWKGEVCSNLAISYSWMAYATHWAVDLEPHCPLCRCCWNISRMYHSLSTILLTQTVPHCFTVCHLICLIFAVKEKHHWKYYSSKIQLQVRGKIIFMSFMGSDCHIPLVRCWWFDGRELTKTTCKQSVSLQLS